IELYRFTFQRIPFMEYPNGIQHVYPLAAPCIRIWQGLHQVPCSLPVVSYEAKETGNETIVLGKERNPGWPHLPHHVIGAQEPRESLWNITVYEEIVPLPNHTHLLQLPVVGLLDQLLGEPIVMVGPGVDPVVGYREAVGHKLVVGPFYRNAPTFFGFHQDGIEIYFHRGGVLPKIDPLFEKTLNLGFEGLAIARFPT